MDAIIRTLEAARVGRERRLEEKSGGTQTEVPVSTDDVEFTDTITFQVPTIVLDESRRERERILSPGAVGMEGGAYKLLRTQIVRRLATLGANTLAVLSASAGDGKTLTAINLAVAIAAHSGQTALLVDLDLRNPSIHERFGFQPSVGIDDCLESNRPLHEAMVKVKGYDRLTVLPARQRIGHSSELLASARMREIVEELRSRYMNRVVIFDLPPVLLADDALAFSHHVQCGTFVVAEGKTSREGVKRSLRLLESLTIVGTVLNRSQDSLGAYY